MEIINPKLIFTSVSGYRNKTDYIVIHHTAGNPNTETVESIHEEHLNNNWAGIGYHFFIDRKGRVFRGRPESWIGSHAIGFNDRSIGIALSGNFEKGDPTDEQISSLIELVNILKKKYFIEDSKIVGHRDCDSTACPGTFLYERLNDIRSGVANFKADEIKGKLFAHDKKIGIVIDGCSYIADADVIRLDLFNSKDESGEPKELKIFINEGKLGVSMDNELYRMSFPELNFLLKKEKE